jgi:hypothetical protein
MIHAQRLAANIEGDFVVFLIGMRINRPWLVHKWWPVAQAMPRMLRELAARPDSGLISGEMWFGRTTIMVQYWRTIEQLLAYSKDRQAQHLPAWRAFNRAVGTNGDVGIWHETYRAGPGTYENVYVNMPPFGLGRAGALQPVGAGRQSAEERLHASGQA